MKQSKLKTGLLAAALVAGISALAGLAPSIEAQQEARPIDRLSSSDRAAVESIRHFSDGFAAVASLVTPSVVTITTQGEVQAANQSPFPMNDPLLQRFFGDFFRNPQQGQGRTVPLNGLGSGVVIREDGYIVTNNHVIRGADEFTVTFHDGEEMAAELVGTDPRSDLAVLKVNATDLPAVELADSDDVRIGEWVLAVGSPFSANLSTTVTAGIVSAVGRSSVGLNQYEDYIQTDASINPGNSGGALVNLYGEVVGINTAIASRGGGSNGIGFSIPSNMVSDISTKLITDGRVSRGYLGVQINDVDPDLAEAMGAKGAQGAFVQAVQDGTPAYDAGIKDGDIIVELDGQELKDSNDLRFRVAQIPPGTMVSVKVLRDGREKDLFVELAEYEDNPTAAVADPNESHNESLGLTVEPITPQVQRQLNLQNPDGLVITSVSPRGPAAEKGLRTGDVILEINRKAIGSLREYREVLSNAPENKPVLFLIQRGEATTFVAVRPE